MILDALYLISQLPVLSLLGPRDPVTIFRFCLYKYERKNSHEWEVIHVKSHTKNRSESAGIQTKGLWVANSVCLPLNQRDTDVFFVLIGII
jgi:hypothetical protein